MVGEPRGDQAAAGASHSRRALLTGGAAAATAALISACSGGKPLREKVSGGGKVAPADVEPLNALLDVEHYAVAAYAAGIPLLHPPQSKSAIQFLAQELAHTVQLSDLIHHAKGKPRRPRASYDLANDLCRPIHDRMPVILPPSAWPVWLGEVPATTDEVLALLKHVEQIQIHAYVATLPRLQGNGSRAVAASIMANDAQHLAMLRWQTGETPVPAALVTGS